MIVMKVMRFVVNWECFVLYYLEIVNLVNFFFFLNYRMYKKQVIYPNLNPKDYFDHYFCFEKNSPFRPSDE